MEQHAQAAGPGEPPRIEELAPASAEGPEGGGQSADPRVRPGAAPSIERPIPGGGGRLRPPTPRVALLLLSAVVVGFLLFLGRDALSPFVVGLLIVYLLDPPVERLARLRLPRWLAILLVYGVVVFVVIEGLSLTLTPLVQQISTFLSDLPQLAQSLDSQLRRLSEVYRGLDLPPEMRQTIDQWLREAGQNASSFDPTVLLPVFGSLAGLVTTIFGYLILPVWVFYLLKDRPALTTAFDRSLPAEWRADAWAVIHIVERVFSQWVRGQLILGLTVGVFTYVGLLGLDRFVDPIFGRFALLLAIIAGLFELLPIIGPIIGAIPAVLLAATAGGEAAIAALALYFVVQQVENNLLVPKIQGDATRLHPSAVMFALIVGGAIAGLLGAILALPVAAAGRDVFRYVFGRLSREPLAVAAVESGVIERDERPAGIGQAGDVDPQRARRVAGDAIAGAGRAPEATSGERTRGGSDTPGSKAAADA
ncbi:MAG TPA: AI-2E family transporter [Candidatus Limnocylindrales bacterium]